jgi:hypothetical protein
MAARKRTNEEWRALIVGYEASGQTQEEWCTLHGINLYTFRDRARRLRKADREAVMCAGAGWVEVKQEQRDMKTDKTRNSDKIAIKAGAVKITAGIGYPVAGLALLLRELARSC